MKGSEQDKKIASPIVYNYSNPMGFIRDTYAYLKGLNSDYTIRRWAKDMNVESPALIVDIMNGRRILKSKYVDVFAKGLKLTNSEKIFLLALVYRASAETSLEKTMGDLMIENLRKVSRDEVSNTQTVTNASYLSHWVDTAILEMTKLKDFDLTEESIRASLRYPVDLEIIKERVLELQKIGLLKRGQHGQLVKAYDSITTQLNAYHLGARESCKQNSQLIASAVELSSDQRELHVVSVSIKKSDIHKFKTALRECRNQIESLSCENADSVYQTNLFFYPLTL